MPADPKRDTVGTERLLGVVHRLAAQTEPSAEVLGASPTEAFLAMADGSLGAVLVANDTTADRVREIADKNPHLSIKFIVLGGSPAIRSTLRAVQPLLMARRIVQAYHLGPDDAVWVGRRTRADSQVGRALTAVANGEGPAVTPEMLAPLVAKPAARADAEVVRTTGAFVSRIRGRVPRATYTLLAVIAVVFVAETLWGGSEFTPTLVRMGGNTADTLGPEPWRLLSSAVLHAGLLHAAVNGYVLYALGSFFERLWGWSRTVILLVAAAVGGSIASAVMAKAALSVGASGALWGLLGAGAALSMRPAGVIPAPMVPGLRRTAVINLLINLSISFLPQIDMMAHLGGGAVGAALVGSGILLHGLSPADDPDPPAPDRGRWRVIAALAIALVVVSVSAAWHRGRPWEVSQIPTVHDVAAGPVTVALPDALGPLRAQTDAAGERSWVAGDLLHDPVVVAVAVQPLSAVPTSDAEVTDALQDWATAAAPTDAVVLVAPAVHRDPLRLDAAYRYPNGIEVRVRDAIVAGERVTVEVASWPEASPGWIDAARSVVDPPLSSTAAGAGP